jgi:MFS family permease
MGSIVMAFSEDYNALLVGRVLAGLGVGSALMCGPLYTAELSPQRFRGALVTVTEVAINVGIVLGYVVGYLLVDTPTETGWRWMLGLGTIPAGAVMACVVLMPESPRWLMDKVREWHCPLHRHYQHSAYSRVPKHSPFAARTSRCDVRQVQARRNHVSSEVVFPTTAYMSYDLQGRVDEAEDILITVCTAEECEMAVFSMQRERDLARKGSCRMFFCPPREWRGMILVGMATAIFSQVREKLSTLG